MSESRESTVVDVLGESEQHYRQVFENTSDCMFLIDVTAEGGFRIARFNPAGERVFGQPNAKVAGKLVEEVLSKDAAAAVKIWYGKCVAHGAPINYEEHIPSPSGDVWFDTTLIPLKDAAGHVYRIVGTTRNTSEHRKLQEQVMTSDRMASVGMLAASVAHEINNPLAAVMGNLYLAVEFTAKLSAAGDPLLRELHEELVDSVAAAERICKILRDLRIFSRTNQASLRSVEVEPILESSLRMALNEVRHRALVVRDYAPVLAVEADESRLGQVFLNLIVNAAQAIEEGHAASNQIKLVTRMNGASVVIEIHDTGAGMAPEQIQQLFTPFFTTKAVGIGTGLGLTICHRIVTDLGGTITVESTPGHGSVFRVTLPAAKPVVAEQNFLREIVKAPRRARVLVIDDEELLGTAARRILESEHDVITTVSAREALQWIEAGERFDVILCDLMMPDINGWDFHSKLRQVAPALANQIIFMTGGAFSPRAQDFLEQVSNPRLTKPFDPTTLRNIVNRSIAGR